MSAFLHQQRWICILIAAATIACGILFLVYGVTVATIICQIAGAFLLALGAFYTISFFVSKTNRAFAGWAGLFTGVLCFAAGAWMLLSPQSAIRYMQYVIALIILVHGVLDLQAAIQLARTHLGGWLYALILSLVTLGLGIWILLEPMGATKTLMTLMGIVLIIDGVTDLVIIMGLSRTARRIRKDIDIQKQSASAIETSGTVDGNPIDPES